MTKALAGKHALIVGASDGIGKACALTLAANGADVFISSRRKAQSESVVNEIISAGGKARYYQADVTSSQQIQQLVEHVVAQTGGLDIAVNNAGIEGTPFTNTVDYEENVFDAVIDTNLKGVWRCMKYQIPHIRSGGVIINMSSIAGIKANEMMGCAYTASKHAVIGMTKTAAREFAHAGIRVNAICPGVIETDIANRSFLSDENTKRKVLKMHPIGRFGTTQEVADAVLWMASDQSSFMTGHALVLDGGASC